MTAKYQALSETIEQLMVSRNLRGMQQASSWLRGGYFMRAAKILNACQGTVLIGTGFPVAGTFETDGPVGAIALYQVLQALGKTPVIVCGDPLFSALRDDYLCHQLPINPNECTARLASDAHEKYQPSALVSIERPGITACGNYRNMRGEIITEYCGNFDQFLNLATCPTIAIGDGGNEIGMGNIAGQLSCLDIHASHTQCDELLVADVSNWAAYGLIALLSLWHQTNFLAEINLKNIFEYLYRHGAIDGVTREKHLTEDSLCFSEGQHIINQLQSLCGLSSGVSTP